MAVDIKEMREREKKNVLNLRPDEIGIPRRVWRYVTWECGKNPRNGESATVAQLINYTASELMNAKASIGTVAKLATTSSTGGLILALIRADCIHALKAGITSIVTGPL